MADNETADNETAAERELSALVRRHASRHTAPPGLAERIGGALAASQARRTGLPSGGQWRPLALAASLLLAVRLSSGPTWNLTAPRQPAELAQPGGASPL